MNKLHLAWIGDKKVTFGSSNAKTGKHSFYGYLIGFKTKCERDQFVSEYFDYNKSAYQCTVNTARKYFLGLSIHTYNEMVNAIEVSYIEDVL